jgi:hypothetical protein
MNSAEKLTPKQEKMARIIADIFEMSDMSTAEASRVLECLLEVTKPSIPPENNGPRLRQSMSLM